MSMLQKSGPSVHHAVFSIATNGYEKTFERCLQSQWAYCQRLGVPYFLVTGSPPWGICAHDSAWLKLPILYKLLRRFRGGVLYLDADCEVFNSAPDFRAWDQEQPSRSVFACLDFSNRINSAVIYCRGTKTGLGLMRRMAWSAWVPEFLLPRSDRNLYENGHFIWVLKNNPQLHVMPQVWNAGIYSEEKHPYIVHHGGTIMREMRGERPLSLRSRLFAAWTAVRLPFHQAYFRKCLVRPVEEFSGSTS